MRDYGLGFIPNDVIFNHVKHTVGLYRTHIDLKEFNKNIIDPIKLTFDAKVYGKILPIYYVSAKDGSGLEKVKECMKHKVTAFAGQSAVGKSTLISALFQMSLDTGSLSKKVERGKHTTRHTELFHVGEDIWVMDTPGFSLYELNQIPSQELQNYYPEFASYKQSCKFSNCVHTTQNANVCGVVQAVQEGKIDMGRYQRYVTMFHAMQQKEQQF